MATKKTISTEVLGGVTAETAYNQALTENNISGNAPSADNYTFVGWVDENGNDVVLSQTVINSSKTFTAKYTYNSSVLLSWNATPAGVGVFQIYDSTTNSYPAVNPTESGSMNVGNGDTIVVSVIKQSGYGNPTLTVNGTVVTLEANQYSFVATTATTLSAAGGSVSNYSFTYTASQTGIQSYTVYKNGSQIASGSTFVAGDTLSVTATPSTNYSLSYTWKNTNNEVISTSTSITAPATGVSLTIVAQSSIQAVSITPSIGSDGKTLRLVSNMSVSTIVTVSGTYTSTGGATGTISATISSGSSSGYGAAASAQVASVSGLSVSPASYGSQTYTVSPTSITTPSVTVTYNANGGTGSTQSQSVLTGGYVTLRANAFTPPANKGFAGWGTNSEIAKYDAGDSLKVTSNTTIYAVWSDVS